MKPSKNGSGNVKLDGLHRVTSKGRTYYYAWRGGPALPDPEVEPTRFAELFAKHTKARGEAKKTVSTLIDEYLQSPEWKRLGGETQRVRTYRIDALRREFGDLELRMMDASGVRGEFIAWRDGMAATPQAADGHIEAANVIFNWGVDREKMPRNPCKGIAKLYSSNRSDVIFSEDELERILARARPDFARVIRVALATGLRASDIADLRWKHVDLEDGILEKPTKKSRESVTAFMAILPPLRAVLTECGEGRVVGPDTHVMLRAGKRWSPAQISDAFAYLATRTLRINKHFHDLRGNAATALVAAGVPSPDVDAWMGWKPGKGEGMKRRYVARREVAKAIADRLALANPEKPV